MKIDKQKLDKIKKLALIIESNLNLSQEEKQKLVKIKQLISEAESEDKNEELKSLIEEFKQIIDRAKEDSNQTFGGLRQKTVEAINQLFIRNDVNKKLNEKLKEADALFARIDEKLAKVRNGRDADEKAVVGAVLSQIRPPKDGKDGKDADEKVIIDKVLKKIEPPKVDYSKLEDFEKTMREELSRGKRIMTPAKPTGKNTSVDTSNFNNNLSSTDDTVQKALDTLDNLDLKTRCWDITITSPSAYYAIDTQIPVALVKSNLTITKIQVSNNTTAQEVAGDLKYADDLTSFTNPVVINDFDTTSGVRTDTSITSASVAAGKWIYLQFDSQPNAAITWTTIHIEWNYN